MIDWRTAPDSASNLRLYERGVGWKQYDDEQDPEGKTVFFGSNRAVELALSTALNASNLLLMTGAGSSFCAVNPPGILSAPGMQDLWTTVEAADPQAMKDVLALIPGAQTLNKNIEKLLTLCKLYVALFSDGNATKIDAFVKLAEKAILARVDFVDENTNIATHRSIVRKLSRRGLRKPRAKIFTTNYDLCFEYAARQQQFVVIDGFSHSNPQFYDRAHFSYDIVRRDDLVDGPDYIENVLHLYKLHGSSDWKRKGSTIVRSKLSTDGDPVLIYPRDSKYQEAFETPYLDMMSAFQTALRQPDTALIVSGFGFNDDHISKPIMAAIEANMSLKVVICDIAFLDDTSLQSDPQIAPADAAMRFDGKYFKQLKALADADDRRITLLNGRFQDLARGLPDLVAETERERHVARIDILRALDQAGTTP